MMSNCWYAATAFLICVDNLNIIVSDNGLSPGWHQAIIWTNSGILLIGPLGRNFSGILSEIHIFSFQKMCLKMSSEKFGHFVVFCVLTHQMLVPCAYSTWPWSSLYMQWPSSYPLTTSPFLAPIVINDLICAFVDETPYWKWPTRFGKSRTLPIRHSARWEHVQK